MAHKMIINKRLIDNNSHPYIIAEMSANHNGSLENAFKILETAKQCGADAVKIQTYTPDTITLNCDREEFKIKSGLWAGKTLYQLYEEAHMPWEWHKPLFDRARDLDLTLFSSPFDETAVDLLESLDVPAYKIASFEAIDIPLIEYVAKKKKPMIISTGMASSEEIQEALDAAKLAGCDQVALLHCVSGYPAPAHDYNLSTIPDMIERFDTIVGLSDHTIDNVTAISSVALGATIIEKHFTLNRAGGGPDDSFSIEPLELANLCRDSKTAWSAKGSCSYERQESEKANIQFRRSLYFIKDMKPGEMITSDCIKSVRPGFGLPPKHLHQILGQRVTVKKQFGEPVTWTDIES